MSRRTRSNRSRRSVENRLSALESDHRKEYPEATGFMIFNAASNDEYEEIEGETNLVRCHGEIYRVPPDGVGP